MSDKKEKKYVDFVISVNRVTKVTKGGKRFSFSAFVVSGDEEGNVGIGSGKSSGDVSAAIAKATTQARKNLIPIARRGETIPYPVIGQHGATRVIIRSAYKGSGLKAGKHVAAVAKAAGIRDLLSKVIGPSRCGRNVVKATLNALAQCRTASSLAYLRNKTVAELVKDSHEHA
ncbi:MAG: 30S ribosomal protein S5 [Candidatus Babeliaceae bacterium]